MANATRKRYRFKDRATAEEAYLDADSQRLYTEWLLTALIQKRAHVVGTVQDGSQTLSIGYITLTHSGLVYCLSDADSIHCVRGIWEFCSEQLGNVIGGLVRYEDSHQYGMMLEKARLECACAFKY